VCVCVCVCVFVCVCGCVCGCVGVYIYPNVCVVTYNLYTSSLSNLMDAIYKPQNITIATTVFAVGK